MLNIFVRVATLIKVEISWRVWLSNTMYLWLLNWVIGHAVAPPQSLYSFFSRFPADTHVSCISPCQKHIIIGYKSRVPKYWYFWQGPWIQPDFVSPGRKRIFIIFFPVSLPPYRIKFNKEIGSYSVSQTPGIFFFICYETKVKAIV